MAKWNCRSCGHIGFPEIVHGDEKCEKCWGRYVTEMDPDEENVSTPTLLPKETK